MKFYIVSDDADTCTGLRLAGVFFFLAHDEKTAEESIKTACDDPDTGILMITGNIRKMCSGKISAIEKSGHPLIIEIPDSRNAGKSSDSLGNYIRSTVGISI